MIGARTGWALKALTNAGKAAENEVVCSEFYRVDRGNWLIAIHGYGLFPVTDRAE
jgi:hypothetical protein